MKNFTARLIVLFLFLIVLANGKAQNIHVISRSEHIQVLSDTTYRVDVTVLLKASDQPVVFPVFYDQELEKISDLRVYRQRRNQFRLVRDPEIAEETIELDYINSRRVKFILIPPGAEAKVAYTVSCNELMYFADLRFFSLFDTDTLKYRVTVPEEFGFSYTTTHTGLLEHLSIDSLKTAGAWEWNIEVVPEKADPDPLMFFGIYRDRKLPIMRTVVVPEEYKNREVTYLNDWYLGKREAVNGLDSLARAKIDELTDGITEPELIMEILFDFVKTSFKYVSIQIGMGAFVPSPADEVFLTKQGDCKDLSNFLCEALNYKGVECNLALAATFNHISDCDFPSLGSANHIVSVAWLDGRPVLLDPTDPIHTQNHPIQSMQGRKILIVSPRGGEFFQVETYPPHNNRVSYDMQLQACSDQSLLSGGFSVQYEGISGNFLKRTFLDLSGERKHRLARQHYTTVFNNQAIPEITHLEDQEWVAARGELSMRGKIFNDRNRQLIFFDFLPRLIESEQRETLLEGTYIGNTMSKHVNVMLTMDRDFEPFDLISHVHEENGVSLSLTISNPSQRVIHVEYEFILDHIYMDEENTDLVNQILNAFKKLSDEPLILNIQT